MSGVTVSPVAAAYSPAQPPLPTPSPFSFSVASTRWSSRPPVQTASILLRFLSLIFSFGSAFALVALPSTNTKLKKHPELLYCFNANILTAIYSAYQIFKNICDYAQTCIFISDTASDYISFIFDQVAGYVLISASSVAVPLIQQMEVGTSLRNASVVSVCFSFASFLVTALAAFLSGYKLCKRIMW
ncbi:CASP-like protein 4A4 isoform X2 [Salvia miltiorrhiza]|uniref:CASP-like protein 4A4 isoform X2 n=1 Tax=Salvia miltiorrhiza TaxID=226208 RepID=UPI0025AC2C72|nr:CASP-like protein 4A4 isoform X2 [Salvia miltiorrhiza]